MRYSSFKIKFGAPAAMLLAASVATAVSSETLRVAPQPCFAWTMNAAAPLATQSARVFLAKEAANSIRALDLVSSVHRHGAAAREADPDTGRAEAADFCCISCTRSSHQHAAP